jgi:hypothetical protein
MYIFKVLNTFRPSTLVVTYKKQQRFLREEIGRRFTLKKNILNNRLNNIQFYYSIILVFEIES